MEYKKISKTLVTSILGLAVVGSTLINYPIINTAAESNSQNISETNTKNIADIDKVTEAFLKAGVYTDYFGGYHTVTIENQKNNNVKYLIIFMMDISDEKKEEFMEITGIPQADNILFKKCSYSYNELTDIAEEIGDTYSYKKICFIENIVGINITDEENINEQYNEYIEEIKNNTFDETKEYKNSIFVYMKDAGYEETKNSLYDKYEDKIIYLTQTDWNNYVKDGLSTIYSPDVNKDGKSDLNDAQMILKGALGVMDFTYNEFMEADMNQDERLSLEDAQIALKRVLRIPD